MSAPTRIEPWSAITLGWRGKTLADVRIAFISADEYVVEAWRCVGNPAWECDGMLAVATAYTEKVRVTFLRGAELQDVGKVFNAGLSDRVWRSVDFRQGDVVDMTALKALVREAIALNRATSPERRKPGRPRRGGACRAVKKHDAPRD